MSKILVVGSINEDVSLRVASFPVPGETLIADHMNMSNGGKGANQAVALQRLGARTSLLGAVGRGSHMISDFVNEGIDVSHILELDDVKSGMAFITVDAKGENTIVVYPGANHGIRVVDVLDLLDYIDDFDFCLLQLELPLEVVYAVIDICASRNIKVVLNPAPFDSSFDLSYLSKLDYFVPNEVEFRGVMNDFESDLEVLIRKFSNLYDCILVVTLGSKGSALANANEIIYVSACLVDVVDTTAAGDTYIGAFLSALMRGSGIESAMEFASRAAAIAVGRRGAQDSIPYLREL